MGTGSQERMGRRSPGALAIGCAVLLGLGGAARAQGPAASGPLFLPFSDDLAGRPTGRADRPSVARWWGGGASFARGEVGFWPPTPPLGPERKRLVAEARRLLASGAKFADCSSFVLRVFRGADLPVFPQPRPGHSISEALFHLSTATLTPRPGDIAVFHDTYDRNRDGKRNDAYSHVAVVERVDGDVVTMIHRGSRGVARLRMNLRDPDDRETNDPLRSLKGPSGGKILSGQLFAGFGALVDPPLSPVPSVL